MMSNAQQPSLFAKDDGSGATILAAENLGRQCRAVEIDPRFVAVALQWYADTTGIKPELA